MPEIRTSSNHPIEVSFLRIDGPGRVGLTLAPGKNQWAKRGYRWDRDLAQDLDRLRGFYSTDVLVVLLEDHELFRLGVDTLFDQARTRGMEVHHHPIPDGGAPPSHDDLLPAVEVVRYAWETGQTVVIHCAGGLGRTGTVAGCFLRQLGWSSADTLAELRRARGPRCPENDLQRAFIRTFATTRPPNPWPDLPNDPPVRNRVLGAVLGAAIGDALGAPVEFIGSVAEIRQRFGADGVQGYVSYSGAGRARHARYTDDTQMAEAVLRGLLDSRAGGADLDGTMLAIAERFVTWNHSPQGGHRAPGNACLSGCGALARGVPWREAGGPTAGGCGSVMRAYPFGLVFANDPERAATWAAEHSRMTHADPIALASCAAMAKGIALLVGGRTEGVLDEMIAAAGTHSGKTASMMQRAIDEAADGIGPDVTLDRLRSWAAHEAIAAGVYLLARHPDDTPSAILEGANTPGDSDSIATIVGALLGARNGLESIPSEWVRDVERSSELLALGEGILHAEGERR